MHSSDLTYKTGNNETEVNVKSTWVSFGLVCLCFRDKQTRVTIYCLHLCLFRNLADIVVLSSFVHLRFLDISSNYLTDLSPLATLTDLLWLKADFNQVQSFRGQPLSQFPYLQWLSLMSNCLSDTDGLGGPALESLNLRGWFRLGSSEVYICFTETYNG